MPAKLWTRRTMSSLVPAVVGMAGLGDDGTFGVGKGNSGEISIVHDVVTFTSMRRCALLAVRRIARPFVFSWMSSDWESLSWRIAETWQ